MIQVFPGGQLCPMAWNSELPNGNFSLSKNIPTFNLIGENGSQISDYSSMTVKTWMPVHPNYGQINVERRSGMVKIVSDLINFRMDYLYNEPIERADIQHEQTDGWPSSMNRLSTTSKNSNQPMEEKGKLLAANNRTSKQSYQIQHTNYLFHYIDQTVVVLEQYFDRFNPSNTGNFAHQTFDETDLFSKKRFRYVVFVNLGNETVVKDFSDKFHFSLTQLATNVNRTSEFLIMKTLRLDSGEAMIATVE